MSTIEVYHGICIYKSFYYITPVFRYSDQPQPPITQVICVLHRGCQRATFCINVHSTLFSGVYVYYWHTMESVSIKPPVTPLFRYAGQPQPPITQVICVHRGCQRATFCMNVHSTLISEVNVIHFWYTMESVSIKPPITPMFRYSDQPQPPIAQVICVHRGCQRAACSGPGSGLIDGTP